MRMRELYVRGSVQMAAAIAIVTGAIGWIAGWRYGHGLITLALIVYAITLVPNPRKSLYLGLAHPPAERAAKSFGAGRFEEAADDLAEQVGYLRKLAFAQPREARDLGQALIGQWSALTKLGRHADALVVAEEAVAVSRIADSNPAERPALDRALELVESSLSEFPDDPVGPETDELLRLRAERADDANRAQARALTIVAERHAERREYAAARPLLEQAARIHRHLASGPRLVNALNDLGNCLIQLDEHEQAQASYAEGLAVAGALDRADPDDVFALQVNLAGSLRELERYADAVPLDYAVVAKLRADHQSEDRHEKSLVRLGWALTLLIDDLRALGRDDEARALEDELSALTPESDQS